jgi:hypothetical protein
MVSGLTAADGLPDGGKTPPGRCKRTRGGLGTDVLHRADAAGCGRAGGTAARLPCSPRQLQRAHAVLYPRTG